MIDYFKIRILSHLLQGENVLIAAHGNSLRSIIMMLDRLSPQEVTALEIPTGVPIVYDLDVSGEAIGKQILND